MRELASELRVLPISLDMGGCYCLRSDGEIFSFTWDEPRELRVEGEERIKNSNLFEAAKKFHQLKPLEPDRPVTAKDVITVWALALSKSFRRSSPRMFVVFVVVLGGYRNPNSSAASNKRFGADSP